MTWRSHLWELFIGTSAWIVAIIALVGILAFAAFEAAKRHARRKGLR